MIALRRLNSFCRFTKFQNSKCISNISPVLCQQVEKSNPPRYITKEESLTSEFLNHSDTFGNYREIITQIDKTPDDAVDIEELERQRIAEKRTIKEYIEMIKSHLEKHDYKGALDVLEVKMLKIDRKKPVPYVFDLLISYNGRHGNLKEAMRLYNRFKERQLRVHGGTYTALFNACANCNDREYALKMAHKIRAHCNQDTKNTVNIKNYNSMIKAFGRQGDLSTALSILDEVLEKRGRVLDETYNFLLQACITDRNAGFRHAMQVWHQMLKGKTSPSIYSFNLMLRAVRDCSLGPQELINDVVKNILKEGHLRSLKKSRIEFIRKQLTAGGKDVPTLLDTKLEIGTPIPQAGDVTLPNLLALKPAIGSVVDFESIVTPHDRLMLFGDSSGFLKTMTSFAVAPDVKTATLLLDVIPSTLEAEESLINLLKDQNVVLDTGFFNVLIKRRCFRLDYQAAQAVLPLLQAENLKADIITFGVLALSCMTLEEGSELVQNIREAGFRLNSEILGGLLGHATRSRDLKYVNFILKVAKEDEVEPSAKFVIKLGSFVENEKKLLNNTE